MTAQLQACTMASGSHHNNRRAWSAAAAPQRTSERSGSTHAAKRRRLDVHRAQPQEAEAFAFPDTRQEAVSCYAAVLEYTGSS